MLRFELKKGDIDKVALSVFKRKPRPVEALSGPIRANRLSLRKNSFFLRMDLPENGLRIDHRLHPFYPFVLELHILVVGRSSSSKVSRSK